MQMIKGVRTKETSYSVVIVYNDFIHNEVSIAYLILILRYSLFEWFMTRINTVKILYYDRIYSIYSYWIIHPFIVLLIQSRYADTRVNTAG